MGNSIKTPVSGLVDTHASLEAFHRLQRRRFKAATSTEAWMMMNQIISAASGGVCIPVEAALWLTSAVERSKAKDIESLIRELGLVEKGQPKKYDRYAISDRVDSLIKGGMTIMGAARLAAKEFGCSYKTAHHYGVQIRGSIVKDGQQ